MTIKDDKITRQFLVENDAQMQIEAYHKELLARATWLAERMNTLVDRLKREGTGAPVNSLGEVQGAGLDVDRACIEFAAAHRAAKFVARTVQATEFDRTQGSE